jgi:hypothetical protein
MQISMSLEASAHRDDHAPRHLMPAAIGILRSLRAAAGRFAENATISGRQGPHSLSECEGLGLRYAVAELLPRRLAAARPALVRSLMSA